MSQKEWIEDLERKVEELEKRVKDQEKKPPVFAYPVWPMILPVYAPPVPYRPAWNDYPTWDNQFPNFRTAINSNSN